MSKPQSTPPKAALLLMSMILPKQIESNLIGDLIEEYQLLIADGRKDADAWFWRQAMETNLIYISSLLRRPSVLRKLNILVPFILFTFASLLITWLSHMDSLEGYTEGMWQSLLEGKIHLALFEPAFWQEINQTLLKMGDLSMYLHLPSMLFTSVSMLLLYKLDKKLNFSVLKMAVWGYGLMLVPYSWALIHINTQQLMPTQIGPLLAFGLITIFYMILPISYMVNKKLIRFY